MEKSKVIAIGLILFLMVWAFWIGFVTGERSQEEKPTTDKPNFNTSEFDTPMGHISEPIMKEERPNQNTGIAKLEMRYSENYTIRHGLTSINKTHIGVICSNELVGNFSMETIEWLIEVNN